MKNEQLLALADSTVIDTLKISIEQQAALKSLITSLYGLQSICQREKIGISEVTSVKLVEWLTGLHVTEDIFEASRNSLRQKLANIELRTKA